MQRIAEVWINLRVTEMGTKVTNKTNTGPATAIVRVPQGMSHIPLMFQLIQDFLLVLTVERPSTILPKRDLCSSNLEPQKQFQSLLFVMRSLPERLRPGRRSLAPDPEALVLRGVL